GGGRRRGCEEAVAAARYSLDTERAAATARLTELRQRAADALGALPSAVSSAWASLIADPGDQGLGDALHAAWVEGDRELAGFEGQARRIEEAGAATAAAHQGGHGARGEHETAGRAGGTGRRAARG